MPLLTALYRKSFKKLSPILILILTTATLNAQEYVFAGSFNWDKDKKGIYVFSLDTVSGKLKYISSIDSILNPAYVTISANGQYLYACTGAHSSEQGSVSSYAFDSCKGKLLYINKQSSNGENPVYVTTDKSNHWLINANYTEGNVSVYPLNDNGKIAPATQVIAFDGKGTYKDRQQSAHIHAAVFAPNEDNIFFPDLGSDKIRHYRFNGTLQQPLIETTPSFSPAMPGSGPRHFTFHPNGRYCYCIEELSGYVSVYDYSNGSLVCKQRITAHKNNNSNEHSSADIHVSPDGAYLYASNRGDENNIAIYSIDAKTGQLKATGYKHTSGNHPRMFAITPSGKYLIVANQFSGDIVVFKRNAKNGQLSTTDIIKVKGASCIQIRDYNCTDKRYWNQNRG